MASLGFLETRPAAEALTGGWSLITLLLLAADLAPVLCTALHCDSSGA